jgi:hypothetical protein
MYIFFMFSRYLVVVSNHLQGQNKVYIEKNLLVINIRSCSMPDLT